MQALRPLVLALVLVAPVASGAWVAMGQTEPSTGYDVLQGTMFHAADADPRVRPGVYFQGFASVDELTLNPNVAALGSRMMPAGPTHHRVLLGVWKDCNDDGHVGLAESAIMDYPSQLLFTPSICPPGSLFNDHGWVTELVAIGAVDPCEFEHEDVRKRECNSMAGFHRNERVLYANHTMVWADLGAPDAVPPAECPLHPPRGTTSGTAPLLAYGDCQLGYALRPHLEAADPDGLREVEFPITPFGGPRGPGLVEAGTGSPAATAWDCAQPRNTEIREPTGRAGEVVVDDPSPDGRLTGPQQPLPVVGSRTIFADDDGDNRTPGVIRVRLTDEKGNLVWAPAPDARVAEGGSWWDALEHAADGPRGDCDGETAARPFAPGPLVESGAPLVHEARKDRVSLAFTFYDGHRGLNGNADVLGPDVPSDGGLTLRRHDRGGAGPMWNATTPTLQDPHPVTRGETGVASPTYWTYYARLGDEVLDGRFRVPGSGATYGLCGLQRHGSVDGWVCDPELWWKDALGGDARPRYRQGAPIAPVVGEAYHVRDVDCYDGHVTAEVYTSAGLAPSLCPPLPTPP